MAERPGQHTGMPANRLAATWWALGPPRRAPLGALNSFFYVPLILHAAQLLEQQAVEEWRNHPASSPWWDVAAERLASGGPVTLRSFSQGLDLALTGSRDHQAARSLRRLRTAQTSDTIAFDARSSLHDLVLFVADDDGYINGMAQAVILTQFGGGPLVRDVTRPRICCDNGTLTDEM